MKKRLSFPDIFFGAVIHPRETVRKVIKQKYYSFIPNLILGYGFLTGLNPILVFIFSKHVPFWSALFLSALFLPVIGLGGFYLFSWLLFWVGKKVGGKGKLQNVQVAYALVYPLICIGSFLKMILYVPLWIKLISNMDHLSDLSTADMSRSIPVLLFTVLFGFWVLFPTVINISEAHKFSIGKSIKTHLGVMGISICALLAIAIVGCLVVFIFLTLTR
jgi:hypothetical protein